uniref:Cyclic nucleotide-binding domain-containing protein n=1 Tax=Chromera velia CCMP2878 TaxID=1169474 RepID=A0A0G4GGD9_9ALVE|eukprot:Cvel_4660.t1-p1 / transcript=Cvel_4660.t1 / gene=Cvel_4660 / organism=Chromera_velia_CCMP2878 / gene_product=hypothetical protein / transcript_product=hypothetical protein / location=Cvel_scaffold205:97581-106034(-) / protein_length=1261 / sequence_SO=supercontig / SO=protein_coding / is_pseudo=false
MATKTHATLAKTSGVKDVGAFSKILKVAPKDRKKDQLLVMETALKGHPFVPPLKVKKDLALELYRNMRLEQPLENFVLARQGTTTPAFIILLAGDVVAIDETCVETGATAELSLTEDREANQSGEGGEGEGSEDGSASPSSPMAYGAWKVVHRYGVWDLLPTAKPGDSNPFMPAPFTLKVTSEAAALAVMSCEDYVRQIEASKVEPLVDALRLAFPSCAWQDTMKMAVSAKKICCARGSRIVRRGAPANRFFVVMSGTCAAVRRSNYRPGAPAGAGGMYAGATGFLEGGGSASASQMLPLGTSGTTAVSVMGGEDAEKQERADGEGGKAGGGGTQGGSGGPEDEFDWSKYEEPDTAPEKGPWSARRSADPRVYTFPQKEDWDFMDMCVTSAAPFARFRRAAGEAPSPAVSVSFPDPSSSEMGSGGTGAISAEGGGARGRSPPADPHRGLQGGPGVGGGVGVGRAGTRTALAEEEDSKDALSVFAEGLVSGALITAALCVAGAAVPFELRGRKPSKEKFRLEFSFDPTKAHSETEWAKWRAWKEDWFAKKELMETRAEAIAVARRCMRAAVDAVDRDSEVSSEVGKGTEIKEEKEKEGKSPEGAKPNEKEGEKSAASPSTRERPPKLPPLTRDYDSLVYSNTPSSAGQSRRKISASSSKPSPLALNSPTDAPPITPHKRLSIAAYSEASPHHSKLRREKRNSIPEVIVGRTFKVNVFSGGSTPSSKGDRKIRLVGEHREMGRRIRVREMGNDGVEGGRKSVYGDVNRRRRAKIGNAEGGFTTLTNMAVAGDDAATKEKQKGSTEQSPKKGSASPSPHQSPTVKLPQPTGGTSTGEGGFQMGGKGGKDTSPATAVSGLSPSGRGGETLQSLAVFEPEALAGCNVEAVMMAGSFFGAESFLTIAQQQQVLQQQQQQQRVSSQDPTQSVYGGAGGLIPPQQSQVFTSQIFGGQAGIEGGGGATAGVGGSQYLQTIIAVTRVELLTFDRLAFRKVVPRYLSEQIKNVLGAKIDFLAQRSESLHPARVGQRMWKAQEDQTLRSLRGTIGARPDLYMKQWHSRQATKKVVSQQVLKEMTLQLDPVTAFDPKFCRRNGLTVTETSVSKSKSRNNNQQQTGTGNRGSTNSVHSVSFLGDAQEAATSAGTTVSSLPLSPKDKQKLRLQETETVLKRRASFCRRNASLFASAPSLHVDASNDGFDRAAAIRKFQHLRKAAAVDTLHPLSLAENFTQLSLTVNPMPWTEVYERDDNSPTQKRSESLFKLRELV